jgi:hypothetical protein
METIGNILSKFVEAGERGNLIEEEFFKNRQPKGYQHLPRLVDDLREMSKIPPLQQHDQSHPDEPGWFHDLVRQSF